MVVAGLGVKAVMLGLAGREETDETGEWSKRPAVDDMFGMLVITRRRFGGCRLWDRTGPAPGPGC